MISRMVRGAFFATMALVAFASGVEAQQLQWSGSIWTRFEARNFDGAIDDPRFTVMQTRIGVARAINPRVRFFAQIQDARRWGDELSTTDGSADALDLHQGYFEVGVEARSPLWLRIGRQETEFGSGRLIGTPVWSPVDRSFDGVRSAIRLGDDARVDLFGFQTRENEFGFSADDQTLWGAWGDFGLGGDRRLHLFALHDRDDGAIETARTTLGTEYHASIGVVDYHVEAAVQAGTVADSDLSGANLIAGRVNAPLMEGRGSLGIGFDRYSGDANPGAGESGAFSDLFGRNHRILGFADLFSDPSVDTQGRGLQNLNVRGTWGLSDNVGLQVDFHRFTVADDDGLADSSIADELDVTLKGSVIDGLSLWAGGSWVGADANAIAFGLTPADQFFGYLRLGVAF